MVIELTDSFELLDPRFSSAGLPQRACREALHRLPLGRRAGLVRRRALPGLVGHPQRPHAALGRDRRLGVGVPPAGDEHQWPHGRPRGPARLCEHRGRCVSRTEHDGSRIVLADRFEGKRLNSPNDVVVKSDGSIWFTDPSYGIDSATTKATRRHSEIGALPVSTASMQPAASQRRRRRLRAAQRPGLLARRVAALHRRHRRHAPADGPRHVRRFKVSAERHSCRGGEVFATCPAGLYDGLRVDAHGNLWLSAGDGVHCHAPRRHAAGQDPHPRGGGQRLLRRRRS